MRATTARFLICATAAFGLVAAPVAVAGPADGPRATASAAVKKTVKKLKRQVAELQQQVAAIGQQEGPAGPRGPQGPAGPSTGPAGGDLTGSYPNPLIAGGAIGTGELADGAVTPAKLEPPSAFIDSGVPGGGACAGQVWCRWGSGGPQSNPNNLEYYRDPLGFVHLRGVAEKMQAGTDTVFSLPDGFDPQRNEYMPAAFIGSIQITSSGNVVAGGSVAGSLVSLDGLTFRCGPPGLDGCP